MTATFADRINRINQGQATPVDMIGHGNRSTDVAPIDMPSVDPVPSFSQTFRRKTISNIALGIAWMLPTSWMISNHATVKAYLEKALSSGQDVNTYMDMLMVYSAVSILIMVWLIQSALFSTRVGGSPAFALGVVAGFILGIGPLTFMGMIANGGS